LGIECLRGNLGDLDSLARAIEGCEIVFHVAAKVGVGERIASSITPT
jgi:nucleoside-diphosphate-sugar epimerase